MISKEVQLLVLSGILLLSTSVLAYSNDQINSILDPALKNTPQLSSNGSDFSPADQTLFSNLSDTKNNQLEIFEQSFQAGYWKENLKNKLSLNINPHFRVGLESLKVKPLDDKREILSFEASLQPKMAQGAAARGYGVGMKIQFD